MGYRKTTSHMNNDVTHFMFYVVRVVLPQITSHHHVLASYKSYNLLPAFRPYEDRFQISVDLQGVW
jgi:hypothetical protein